MDIRVGIFGQEQKSGKHTYIITYKEQHSLHAYNYAMPKFMYIPA